VQRVRWVLDAAQRVYEQRETHAAAIAQSTGLSRRGVLFALDRALERNVPDAMVERFAARATPAECVHIVLSSNVFTGCVRALAWAHAASSHVVVKPSRREHVFFDLVHSELRTQGKYVPVVPNLASANRGVLHAYGSDASLDAIAASVSIPMVRFGSGFGIAETSGALGDAMRLAEDICVFDQRGCLSPRIAVFNGSPESARTFARGLAEALADASDRVPLGEQFEAEETTRYIETMRAVGELFIATGRAGTAAGTTAYADSMALPPTGRNVLVIPREALTREHHALLAHASMWAGATPPSGFRGRVAELGSMQQPPFDGPVDVRALP
jgi:hypothetical protein